MQEWHGQFEFTTIRLLDVRSAMPTPVTIAEALICVINKMGIKSP